MNLFRLLISTLSIQLGIGVSTVWSFDSFESVRNRSARSESVILDRNQEILQEFRSNRKVRQLRWVPLSSMSPQLKETIVFSEDRRFWGHHGVDWKALAGASVRNFLDSHKRGASTLSMQLVSLMEKNWAPRRKRRDFFEKVKQVQAAIELEKSWTKEQILEAYLNLVDFRGELRGLGAASFGLFSKAPHGVTQNEALILAALIRSPSASLEEIEKRACILGRQLYTAFECEELKSLLRKSRLQNRFIQPEVALAPHLVDRVKGDGVSTQVTLDRNLQRMTLDVLQKQIYSLREKNVHDAAALVVENRTGQVLSYVGGVGALSSAPYVDGVRAKRQAGSTLKPFLYAMALDRKVITLSSIIDDSPLDISILGSVYGPKNYDNLYHGKTITVRTALGSSLNIPAVKVLNLIGVESFVTQLQRLGIRDLRDPDYYGPSLALGSADISLWDLVNAYRTLANQGKHSELTLQKSDSRPVSRNVISSEVSYLISDVLSDRESRSLAFGLENPLGLKFWTAVKTGTSKDMRDNWCIGYSEKYTVGVWVGNFSGSPMWNVTGVTGAAPAWAEIMKGLHLNTPSHAPLKPLSVVVAESGATHEKYLPGTEPNPGSSLPWLQTQLSSFVRPRITYPVDGMVFARDPDIPLDAQRVYFESSSSDGSLKWSFTGEVHYAEHGQVYWQPKTAGSYVLKLLNGEGQILDSIRFLVR